MNVVSIQWNQSGSVLAVGGSLRASGSEKEINAVQFYTPFGEVYSTIVVFCFSILTSRSFVVLITDIHLSLLPSVFPLFPLCPFILPSFSFILSALLKTSNETVRVINITIF